MSVRTVVKVGGSLSADPARLRALLVALAEGAFGPCLVVPGGGEHADAVRAAQRRDGFDDAEAHRRALDAMSRMADYLHAIEPRLPVIALAFEDQRLQEPGGATEDTRVEPRGPLSHGERGPALRSETAATGVKPSIRTVTREGAGSLRSHIWDPAALRAGHPDIAETWDVTSDSLALWAATQLGAARCILVKSADAPAGADARALARIGLVDAAFPAFAARYGGAVAILGPAGERAVHLRAAA
ncbi:hypothetical protein AFCDBAGC_1931 [Methylobacterium cerastii]|uniref:Uridylate kinase n=1 Tax=Methylobacterium cerastii TaxID=932741 RepID=A0ABQ4QFP5_9HYPH|nr:MULTISPECIES: uridylate kinase [Methylobacterium]GJD44069.1 hypothetical protein AFCDBAGC_1931 [Methylobacterium cerastii]